MYFETTFLNCRNKTDPWNKGKLTGQKPPLQPKHVWAIRTRLHLARKVRDLALFNIAIDSKLRGCDLVRLKIEEIAPMRQCIDRAIVRQQKNRRSVKFELTEHTRQAVEQYLFELDLPNSGYLFQGRKHPATPISTRQYARLVRRWIAGIGLDPSLYGTHSLRRTKPTLIYKRTGNLRAVQLLLGHARIESTVRYLGVEIDDALELSEKIDI